VPGTLKRRLRGDNAPQRLQIHVMSLFRKHAYLYKILSADDVKLDHILLMKIKKEGETISKAPTIVSCSVFSIGTDMAERVELRSFGIMLRAPRLVIK